jgi:integrase
MKIQIENHNGRLRLRWHDGNKRQTLAIGMPDSALGRSVALMKKSQIEEDWHKDRYDPTLVKYRPQTMGKMATIVTAPELFEKFAAYRIKQEHLSRSTIERYQSIANLLREHLNQPASKIDKSQVDRFLRVYADKVCARTLKERCSLIQSAWEWARDKYQLTDDNPWVGAADRFKISPQQQVKPFTLAELQAIRAAFANHPKHADYLDFVTFLMHTACRFGEAAALRWKHLGTDYTTAWIGASVSRGNHRDATKTGKDRTIILSPTIATFLAQRCDRLQPEPVDLVFPNSEGGAMNDNNFRNRQWKEILALCQIEYRKPYAIRHSAISHALANGANPIALAEQTGHDTRVMLKTYAHVIDRKYLFLEV